MIARLIKARYVERRVIDGTSTRYVITDFGRISLDRYYDGATLMPCRFPPPWSIEEHNDACFIVKDRRGQALACVYFENEPGLQRSMKRFTRGKRRRHTT